MIDLKIRFDEFKNANYFSRVDNQHILELHIGRDDSGRKAIELREPFKYRPIKGTSSIDVNQYQKDKYNVIRFSLTDDEMSGLFYTFCDDLIEQTRSIKDETDGYQAIINRFYQWKKMFISSKRKILTEPEIMGLIGEILFLKGLLKDEIGMREALNSWSGQELTHKDFSWKSKWYEVKTIHRGSQTVKISSLEQLDSNINGELIVYSLERMSAAYDGITLNKIIIDAKNMFTSNDEQEEFLTKVALQGYEYLDYYDEYVYEISNCNYYNVTSEFPKLTVKNVPTPIRRATYELSLVDISCFEKKDL